MKQTLKVELVNTSTTAYANFPEIKAALENAAITLQTKHNIILSDIQAIDGQVIMSIDLPNSLPPDFKLGYHLRGVSSYLMKYHHEKYSKLVVAKKLLSYTVIPTQSYHDNTEITLNDRFTAISQFSELLKNSDEVSMNKINRILDILKED